MTVGSDSFAGAPLVPYGFESTPTPSAGLSTEPGEPILASGAGRTAWWKFVAPFSERVGIDLTQTITSDPYASDTYVTVFTGDSLDSLTMVAEGDDSPYHDPDTGERPFGFLTFMDFEAVAGTTYYVQVALWGGSIDCEYVLRLGRLDVTYSDWITRADVQIATPDHYTLSLAESFGGTAVAPRVTIGPGAADPGAWFDAAQAALDSIEPPAEPIADSPGPSLFASADHSGVTLHTYGGDAMKSMAGQYGTKALSLTPLVDPAVDAVDVEYEGDPVVTAVTVDLRYIVTIGDTTPSPDASTLANQFIVTARLPDGAVLDEFSLADRSDDEVIVTTHTLGEGAFDADTGRFSIHYDAVLLAFSPAVPANVGSATVGVIPGRQRTAHHIRPPRYRYVYHSVIAEPIAVYPLRHKQRDDRLGYSPRNRRPSSRQAGLRNSGYL